MADMREALRKAGLVSDKQLRQSKHKDRVHRTEVGKDGLEGEKRRREEALRKEREEKRERDKKLNKERKPVSTIDPGSTDVRTLIRANSLSTGGPRQYFFETPSGLITYFDVNDGMGRQISTGGAAIVVTQGAVKGKFCVVTRDAAEALSKIEPSTIVEWNRDAGDERRGASDRGPRR